MPGVDWGDLFAKYQGKLADGIMDVDDLEHCFFVNHDKTGACCAVYRSLKQKLIVVSFRGTCTPVDLITDASLLQVSLLLWFGWLSNRSILLVSVRDLYMQDAWVEGENIENQDMPKVHAGFRASLASISRRLKELILAAVAPGDSFADYDMLVTGHSLGGALATLFTSDIGQYGVDAGRGLPQLEESEPWWKSIANTIVGKEAEVESGEPPRPKTLRLYNFGSPRVGNHAFADLFDALLGEGMIDQAYRIVNGEDVVARMPRSLNAILGEVRYDHVGATVLISQPMEFAEIDNENREPNEELLDGSKKSTPLLWIEGESDESSCPVRDGGVFANPVSEGSLLSDLISSTKETWAKGQKGVTGEKLSSAFGRMKDRLLSVTASDVGSVFGIGKQFTERELRMLQAVFGGRARMLATPSCLSAVLVATANNQSTLTSTSPSRSVAIGKALAHHLEDEYYKGMGRAGGFLARIGDELEDLDE